MKIAHCIPILDFSGQSINMMKVAYGQQKSGHDVHVCGSYVRDFWDGEKHLDVVPRLDLFSWSFQGDDSSQYDEWLLKSNGDSLSYPDVIFYWGPEDENMLQYLSEQPAPKVRIVGQIYPQAMSPKYLDIFDSFVCFTQLQAEILSYIPNDKLYIIGAPVDIETIKTRPRRTLDQFTIGKLGYAGAKVYDKFPEIVDLLLDEIPTLNCQLIGSEYSGGNHKWGDFEEPDIINLDVKPIAEPVFNDPYSYYSKFDVYIAATSTQVEGEGWSSVNELGEPSPPIETFCTTALEAMACGIPVIVEEKGCIKEWVRHGVDGFVAGNPSEYAHLISRLYHDVDLYYQMAKAARQRAEDFDLARITDKYNKIILDLGKGI
jgi:glycosyltransferase involved in cell wall biosynthesis